MKKIICLMLCAAMVLGVAGCMRQTPETAIHSYFKEIKKTVTLTLNLKVDSEQSLAVVEKFFENFSYEIAGIQEDGEDKAFATLTIHNIDTGTAVKNTLTEYFAFALTTIFHPLSDEEIFCDAIFAISPTIDEKEISERLFGSALYAPIFSMLCFASSDRLSYTPERSYSIEFSSAADTEKTDRQMNTTAVIVTIKNFFTSFLHKRGCILKIMKQVTERYSEYQNKVAVRLLSP